jgi:LysM repeat protein
MRSRKECLMNKEEPYRDQAERLKRRIEKINVQTVETDLLPPREQIHRQKKKKTNFKLKYPVIRLLVLFFILLPIIYFSVISYLDGKKMNRTEKTSGNSVGYETINIEERKVDNNSEKKEEQTETKQDSPASQETSNNVEEKTDTVAQPVQTDSNNQNTNTTSNSNNQDTNTSETVQKNTTTQSPVTSKKMIYHTVNTQETLFKIAMKYYHSADGVKIIKQANHLVNEQIVVGQVLKIPLKD